MSQIVYLAYCHFILRNSATEVYTHDHKQVMDLSLINYFCLSLQTLHCSLLTLTAEVISKFGKTIKYHYFDHLTMLKFISIFMSYSYHYQLNF